MNKAHLVLGSMHVIDIHYINDFDIMAVPHELNIQKKCIGPNTKPCRTPSVMFDKEELEFLTETYCFLFLK